MRAIGAPTERSLIVTLFRALFGPIVWAAHFSLIYAVHTALCVFQTGDAVRAASLALTVAALAAFGLFFAVLRRAEATALEPERFLDRLAMLLIVLSAAGVIWTGAAAAFIAPCAQLR